MPSSPVDPDEIRRAAEDIMSRSEFQEPSPTLVDRVEEWLGEFFGQVFAAGGSGPGAILPWLIMAALIGGTVWLVVHYAGPVSMARRAGPPGLEYGTEGHRPAEEWLAEAAKLAASGDFRGALRCRHQAVIATWISDEVIDHVPGQTAADCHRAALENSLADPSAQVLSGSIVDRFARAWYGGASVDAEGYRIFIEDCARLEAALDRTTASAPAVAAVT